MRKNAAVMVGLVVFLVFAAGVYADSDSMRAPDIDNEEIGDICSELDEQYNEALEYIDEHELEDSRESVARMINLSSRLSALSPSQRHEEFKEQADRLKDKCAELEQAVVGYDESAAWDKISEVRQACYGCHDLYQEYQ